MAMEIVQGMMEILKEANRKHLAEKELQQRQEAQESAAANRLAEQDERDRAFQATIKQHEAANKIAQQAADIQLKMYKLAGAEGLQKIGEAYQKTGVAPGAQIASMASSANGNFSPVNPQQATGAQITIPGMEDLGSIQVATPEIAATRQANLSRITDRPQVEAKIEESRALQSDMLKKQEEAKAADFTRSAMMKIYDDAREERRLTAENERARLMRASMERIARINKGATDVDLTPYAQQVVDGDLTREDVLRLPISKPDQMKLINAVTGAGAGLLSKDQKELVGDFSQMTQAIKLMDQIIANQPQTHNKISSNIAGAFSSLDQNVTGPQEELNGRLSLIARGFAKEKGNLSNQDIERVKKMLPDRFQPVESNIKKRNDYLTEIGRTIDAKMANLPKAQREIIKKKVGLYDYSLSGGPASTQQAAPAGGPVHKYYDANGNEVAAPVGGR